MEMSRKQMMALLRQELPWLEARCAWRAGQMSWTTVGELEYTAKASFIARIRSGALDGLTGSELSGAAQQLMRHSMRETLFFSLYRRLAGWLHGRCRFKAFQSRGVLDHDELFQRVVTLALVRTHGSKDSPPWFDQAPVGGVEAQAKSLLSYCLTRAFHAGLNDPLLNQGVELSLVENMVESGPTADARYEDEGLREILKVLDTVATLPRRLAYLSRDFPWVVDLSRLVDVKNFSGGGSDMVVRSAEETLGLLVEHLPEFTRATKHRPWTLILGAIYYSVQPIELVPYSDRKAGAESIETYARSVVRALIKHFSVTRRATP